MGCSESKNIKMLVSEVEQINTKLKEQQQYNQKLQEINIIYAKCIERASIHIVGNRYMIRDLVYAQSTTQVCDIHQQENSGYGNEQIVDKKLINCLATIIPDTNVVITLKNPMFVFLVTRVEGPIDEMIFESTNLCDYGWIELPDIKIRWGDANKLYYKYLNNGEHVFRFQYASYFMFKMVEKLKQMII
jgi:hypothetical protein